MDDADRSDFHRQDFIHLYVSVTQNKKGNL